MEWRIQAIRGATTVSENTVEAIRESITELLDELEKRNHLHPADMVSVTFSVTRDLDAAFPAAIARSRPHWDCVPMLDVQQMYVPPKFEILYSTFSSCLFIRSFKRSTYLPA